MTISNDIAYAKIAPRDDKSSRIFTITQDAYGIQVMDNVTGVTVILDWNGEELKAIVSREDEDPIAVTRFDNFGKVVA
jgi:hypothetical protein